MEVKTALIVHIFSELLDLLFCSTNYIARQVNEICYASLKNKECSAGLVQEDVYQATQAFAMNLALAFPNKLSNQFSIINYLWTFFFGKQVMVLSYKGYNHSPFWNRCHLSSR
jgi:hypothetical protein